MIARWYDNACCWLAWCLPRRLVKWCAVRVIAHASTVHSSMEMDAISPSQCMKAWSEQ